MDDFVKMVKAEVIRRLTAMERTRQMLVVLTEGAHYDAFHALVEAYEKRGLSPVVLSLLKAPMPKQLADWMEGKLALQSGTLTHLNKRTFLATYEGLLITEMDFSSLEGVRSLRFHGDLGGLIFEVLRQGKPVHVLSKDLDNVCNPVLHNKMGEILAELKSLGMTILPSERVTEALREITTEKAVLPGQVLPLGGRLGRAPSPVEGDIAPLNKSRKQQVQRRHYMTLKELLEQVVKTEEGLVLPFFEDTILTMAAADYAREQGIRAMPFRK